jgi:hypothetical protein
MFGFCLIRQIHYIVSVRLRHPTTRIFLSKSDWTKAYKRLHATPKICLASGSLLDSETLLVHLRLTFGGSPSPSRWSDLSEMGCDLANDLIRDPNWSSTEFLKYLPTTIPVPNRGDNSTPFQRAKPLAVEIPPNDAGKCDVFLDDYLLATPDFGDQADRAAVLLPLIISLLARPPDTNDPLERETLLSLKKFLAEGCPEEEKLMLGWLMNTRKLLVQLPDNKLKNWTAAIKRILKTGKVSPKELDTIVGRLNHAAGILPVARHFMGRIRFFLRQIQAKRYRSSKLHTLSEEVKNDLELWIKFLILIHKGISMNNLVVRQPNRRLCSDACPYGLGGYSLTTGLAWRIQIPDHLVGRGSINFLEFLATVIAIRMDNPPRESCVNSQTDNTSAESWLRCSNFHDENKANMDLARWLGLHIMEQEICLYSEYLPGDDNDIADSLSRDFHLTDSALMCLFAKHLSLQLPQDFEICVVPAEIVSWAFSLVL